MKPLLLEDASRMVDGALERGRALGCHPLTVAVLDPGGHLLALKREDGSAADAEVVRRRDGGRSAPSRAAVARHRRWRAEQEGAGL